MLRYWVPLRWEVCVVLVSWQIRLHFWGLFSSFQNNSFIPDYNYRMSLVGFQDEHFEVMRGNKKFEGLPLSDTSNHRPGRCLILTSHYQEIYLKYRTFLYIFWFYMIKDGLKLNMSTIINQKNGLNPKWQRFFSINLTFGTHFWYNLKNCTRYWSFALYLPFW